MVCDLSSGTRRPPAVIKQPIAHVRFDAQGTAVIHPLEEHLQEVSRISGEFAAIFGNDDWGRIAGLWHDLGKYKADFQEYIRARSGYERDEAEEGGPGKVDHTAAGAIHAVERMGHAGRILAYLIAGHHSGLPSTALTRQFSNSLLENCVCRDGGC